MYGSINYTGWLVNSGDTLKPDAEFEAQNTILWHHLETG